MAFTEIERDQIDRLVGGFCRRHSPERIRNELRIEYRISRHDVLIFEARPERDDASRWLQLGVAKLKFNRPASEWRLFWLRATLKWEAYEPLPSNRSLSVLVHEIDRDPHGCFFG